MTPAPPFNTIHPAVEVPPDVRNEAANESTAVPARPRLALGEALRRLLSCPVCKSRRLQVVAYRTRTVRLRCRRCRNRFSVNPLDVGAAAAETAAAIAAELTDADRRALTIDKSPADSDQLLHYAEQRITEFARTVQVEVTKLDRQAVESLDAGVRPGPGAPETERT